MHNSGNRWHLIALLSLAAGTSGCASHPSEGTEAIVLVGQVDETDVAIGISIDQGNVVLYTGGHGTTIASHSRWFSGAEVDASFELERDGWTVAGWRDEEGAMGILYAPTGELWRWAAEVPTDEVGGLYRGVSVVGSSCRAGVVVRSAELAQGAWCDGEGLFMEVTPMSTPIERTQRGIEVQVSEAGVQFLAEPVWER